MEHAAVVIPPPLEHAAMHLMRSLGLWLHSWRIQTCALGMNDRSVAAVTLYQSLFPVGYESMAESNAAATVCFPL
jgi:hypothetical protein